TPLHSVDNAEDGGGHPAAGAHDLFANTQGGTPPERREGQRAPEQSNAPASGEAAESGAEQGEDFLLHPTEEQGKKRRRKAVTPHWEDVVLGVTTNPQKKRYSTPSIGLSHGRRPRNRHPGWRHHPAAHAGPFVVRQRGGAPQRVGCRARPRPWLRA